MEGRRLNSVKKLFRYSSPFDDASSWRELGTSPRCLVPEQTATDYLYKVDGPPPEEEVRVEIRWGRNLRVIGPGDALMAEVTLPRNHKVRVSRATASVNRNRVITIRVPKKDPPQKWYRDIGLRFGIVFVTIFETH